MDAVTKTRTARTVKSDTHQTACVVRGRKISPFIKWCRLRDPPPFLRGCSLATAAIPATVATVELDCGALSNFAMGVW
jgi:hypothetical protein